MDGLSADRRAIEKTGGFVSHKPRLVFVLAMSRNRVIGANGGLPWRMPSDLKRFKALTMGKPVIMGRKTWDSLPRKPLPGRPNIVVTRQAGYEAPGAVVAGSIADALGQARAVAEDEIAVIGGAEIFDELLPFTDRIYLSEIDLEASGDRTFPELAASEWNEVSHEKHPRGEGDAAGFTLRVLDRIGLARQC
ncbi:MAG: dihydrofolate reductase [Rhizobiales bacterium]|nr:dihydrofolate reductase [Hyphomicrobiales bacterium]